MNLAAVSREENKNQAEAYVIYCFLYRPPNKERSMQSCGGTQQRHHHPIFLKESNRNWKISWGIFHWLRG